MISVQPHHRIRFWPCIALVITLLFSGCQAPAITDSDFTRLVPTVDTPTMDETALPAAEPAAPTATSTLEPAGTPTPNRTASPTLESIVPPAPSPTAAPVPGGIPMPLMGMETHTLNKTLLERLEQGHVTLSRRNALLWSLVEAQEGNRTWGNVATLENHLQWLSELGIETILIVRSTPYWAQKVPGYLCGPVKEDKLQAFASFMGDVVARYSAPPYNVKFFELGNEPDVDPSLVPPNHLFGCWGDKSDEFYGGRYYGEMLKVVYPAIKAANPGAQVLIGGLLLDCDPTHPPAGSTCQSSKYLEGIFEAGAADFFDIVSFHGYNQYWGTVELDERALYWHQRGGVVLGKIDFLRSVMDEYGVNKPIFHTEGAMLCPESGGGVPNRYCNPPSTAFFELQADYIVWMYVRNWAAGVTGTIWYHLEGPGWRNGAVLNSGQEPRPAYLAFKFMMEELEGAYYLAPVSDYPELRGFEFDRAGKRIWVLWSPADEAFEIDLPLAIDRVLDKYGNPIQLEGDRLLVKSPIYIEFSP